MAIPGMSSQEYNNILKSAQDNIKQLDSKVAIMKSDLEKKLSIIRYETEHVNARVSAITDGAVSKDKKMKLLSRDCTGQFEVYGSTIHPVFVKTPVNVFNLRISGTGEYFFREDVSVAVNGIIKEEYKDVLKHDTNKTKGIFFDAYASENLKMEIAMDTANRLGDSRFNMLEIDSFMPGSYDINSIEVYGVDETGNLKTTPTTYSIIRNAGKQRIVFSEKMKFHKMVLNIKLRPVAESGATVYPFGLKHLYLYDADFRSDSYAVAQIKSETPIAIVKEMIRIKTPFLSVEDPTAESTVENEDIRLFIDMIGGELETEIYASTPTQRNEIARTVTTVYARIPVVNKSLTGVVFDIESRA